MSPRFIPLPGERPTRLKDWQSLKADISDALIFEIHDVQNFAAKSRISRHDSVYTGITGIAFTQYHIAKMDVDLKAGNISAKELVAAADRNLADLLHRNPINMEYMYSPDRISFVGTFIGIATLVLIRGTTTSEKVIKDNWLAAKNYLEYTLRKTLAEDDGDTDDESEVLYGRGGLLYALLYLRSALSNSNEQEREPLIDLMSDTTLSRLVDSIMARGRCGARRQVLEYGTNNAASLPPLMWSWHGRRYLGAAHGVAGILQMLLSCPFAVIKKHAPEIFNTVKWLADIQDKTGNWPSKSPSRTHFADNDLVQWCHGAPGVVILLAKATKFIYVHQDELNLGEGTMDKLCQSLDLGAQLVYRRGLLRKGVGLCHGIGGNVYALLAASDALDSGLSSSQTSGKAGTLEDLANNRRRYFGKAMHLALFGKFHNKPTVLPGMRTPDHPWSLYEGMAGMCCAWAEILCRIDTRSPRRLRSGFPAYDDL